MKKSLRRVSILTIKKSAGMPMYKRGLVIVLCFLGLYGSAQDNMKRSFFSWAQASVLPDADGFAGSYAGVSHGALIVAGGANFPGGGRPWSGGVKTWYDSVFVLESQRGSWKVGGRLPRAMGYGVSVSWRDRVICVGGGDAKRNYSDVFSLEYKAGRVEISSLPPLPVPLINACGVVAGDRLYIAGGIMSPSGETTNGFYRLDLSRVGASWEVLPAVPGPSRMLAAAGAREDGVYPGF